MTSVLSSNLIREAKAGVKLQKLNELRKDINLLPYFC